MRRAALAIVSTVAALVLLLSFKTHSVSSSRPAAIGGVTSGNGGGGSATPPTASGPSSTSAGKATSSPSSTAAKTYTGASTDTQWGPVQVQITVRNGKITKVSVVDYPHGNPRDDEINSYALPQLVQETLSAQSAKIDTISGATVTSDGYLGSLQSALDRAGL
jgi:uncharacterized protein with FMN-binding domain